MKHFIKYLAATALLLTAALPIQAQEDNAAFYIYQNDGHFDGFFYDQVQKISYSKLDTLGVEHEDFVSQEIITNDSIYRIMLTAIDSVGFVQPAIKFNPRLKLMDNSQLADYYEGCGINGYNEHIIQFKPDLPEELTPEVGDVLVGLDDQVFTTNGDVPCAGKVYEVVRNQWYVICKMNPLEDFGDVFDQFVGVEQIGTDAYGNVRRRFSGINPGDSIEGLARRAGGNYDLSLFSWNGRLQQVLVQSDYSNVSVGIDLGFSATAQAVYNISGVFSKRFFMKLVFSEKVSAGLSAQMQISHEYEWPVKTPLNFIPAFKFPAIFPLFEIDPVPQGFFRIGGEVTAELSLPSASFGFSQTIVVDTDADDIMTFSWGNLDKSVDNPEASESEFNWLGTGVRFGGFMQGGAKMEIGVKTNSWLASLLSAGIGLDIHAGPKLEAYVELRPDYLQKSEYTSLKNSKVELTAFSFDRELKYFWKVGSKEHKATLWSDSKKFGSTTYYLYPDFLDTEATYNREECSITATVHPRRKVIKGCEIGIGLYRKYWDNSGSRKEYLAASHFGREYGFKSTFNDYTTTFTYDEMKPGDYVIRPLIKTINDIIIPVMSAETKEWIEVDPMVKVDGRDTLVVSAEKGFIDIDLISNENAWELSERYPSYSFIQDEETGKPKLHIEYDANTDPLHIVRRYWPKIVLLQEGSGVFKPSPGISLTAHGIFQLRGKDYEKDMSLWPDGLYYGKKLYQYPKLPLFGTDEGSTFQCSRSGNIFTITGSFSGHVHKDYPNDTPADYDDINGKASLKMIIVDDVENDSVYVQNATLTIDQSGHLAQNNNNKKYIYNVDLELQNLPKYYLSDRDKHVAFESRDEESLVRCIVKTAEEGNFSPLPSHKPLIRVGLNW